MKETWYEKRGFCWDGGIAIPENSMPVVAGILPVLDESCEHYTAHSSIRDEIQEKVFLEIHSYNAGENCKKNRVLQKHPMEIIRCEPKEKVASIGIEATVYPVDEYGNIVDEESQH